MPVISNYIALKAIGYKYVREANIHEGGWNKTTAYVDMSEPSKLCSKVKRKGTGGVA